MNIKNRPLKTQEQIIVFFNENNITFNPIKVRRTEASLKRDKAGTKRLVKAIKSKGTVVEHYGMKRTQGDLVVEFSEFKHCVDIITFSKSEKGMYKVKHPTKKPVALMEYLIKTYTNENETVLDFTMGSGTTGVAAKNTNRNFIGIEKDENYFNISKERINKEEKQLKIL